MGGSGSTIGESLLTSVDSALHTGRMLMEAHHVREQQYDVVLGPCPGCQLWQIDYTYEAARTYVTFDVEVAETFDGEEVTSYLTPNTEGFHEAIEAALQEHLAECPHLQRVLFDFS